MACQYCNGEYNHHDIQCPNFMPKKNDCNCYFCGEYIYWADKCIMNNDSEYAHYDCLNNAGLLDIIDFLGGKIINEF